jgi:hypothetical protein
MIERAMKKVVRKAGGVVANRLKAAPGFSV